MDTAPSATASTACAQASVTALRAILPGFTIEVRRTRRSLLGLRRRQGGLVLRVHPELLIDADCTVSISEWVHRQGRGGPGDALRGLLQRASARMAASAAAEASSWAGGIQTHGDLEADQLLQTTAQRIHTTWFADLPPVPVSWGRHPPSRRLSHLRFGCYRRMQRRIEITPRLLLPWVATVFLEHVMHHEYCHHRQAMQPSGRREGVHSPRFRTWERAFPGFAEAHRWEILALPWLLDGTPPPWYRPCGASHDPPLSIPPSPHCRRTQPDG